MRIADFIHRVVSLANRNFLAYGLTPVFLQFGDGKTTGCGATAIGMEKGRDCVAPDFNPLNCRDVLARILVEEGMANGIGSKAMAISDGITYGFDSLYAVDASCVKLDDDVTLLADADYPYCARVGWLIGHELRQAVLSAPREPSISGADFSHVSLSRDSERRLVNTTEVSGH